MGVQFILLMGVDMGVGLLLMRRMGLWKRLRAAPLSRAQLLGSRIASCAPIGLIVFAVVYAVAVAFFGVRISGSVPGFVAVLVAFAMLTSSFGLMIAALGRTPEATRGLAILATLLMVMLGGAWVPSFIFPPWLQNVSMWMHALGRRWPQCHDMARSAAAGCAAAHGGNAGLHASVLGRGAGALPVGRIKRIANLGQVGAAGGLEFVEEGRGVLLPRTASESLRIPPACVFDYFCVSISRSPATRDHETG